jgi:D-aspartate ligase
MSVACELQPDLVSRSAARAGLLSPPAIVLGGGSNALSIARSLGRHGVAVYALNEPNAHICHSRFARRIRDAGETSDGWKRWLLGACSDSWRGSVLLAASDAALELIAEHRQELESKFLLDLSDPRAQSAMLNKLATYRVAVAAGVPTPRFWVVATIDEIEALRSELVFPLIVKPQLSHVFEAQFGRKFFVAQTYDELLSAFRVVHEARVETLLVERIPGPDSRLCSYYTYLDESGEPLFDFTKRIVRRWPVGMGGACYHVTDHVPRVRDLSLRLLRQAGLRGLANAEFKLDERDGELKLIECNARFTAANGLLADCGLDLPLLVYNRLTGRDLPPLNGFRTGMRLWYPLEDFKAYRQLRQTGELTLAGWLLSLCHRQTLPFFRWSDPWPSLVTEARRLRRAARRWCHAIQYL